MASNSTQAQNWYFDFLRVELRSRNQADAGQFLTHFLRMEPGAAGSGVQQFSLLQRVTECEVRVNSETGNVISFFVDFLSTGGNTSMPADEALQLAVRTVSPPADAELESAEYETMADRTFFRARWRHLYQGLEIEGDYIEVLINGAARKVFSINRVWRTPNLTGTAMFR